MTKSGIILARMKKYDEAKNSFNKPIALKPQSARFWHYLGVVFADQREWAKAIEASSQAINLAPDFMAPRLKRGSCYGQLHNYKLASADSDTVLKTDPANDEALLLRGLANADLRLRQEAITDLSRAYNLARSAQVREAAAAELVRLGASAGTEF